MKKREILELESRGKLYNLILKYPGLHFRKISRELNIPPTTLKYHLDYLRRGKLITQKREGKYLRYYVSDKESVEDKQILDVLRKDSARKIVVFLLTNPNSTRVKISRRLNKRPSTITFHLKKLLELGVIERGGCGKNIQYSLKNYGHMYNLLINYRNNLFDENIKSDLIWSDKWVKRTVDTVLDDLWDIFPHPYHV